MPELPEVETIRRGLEKELLGASISRVDFLWPNILKDISPESFRKRVVGQKITAFRRRAKVLIWELSNQELIILHMKMTGHLIVVSNDMRVGKNGSWEERNKNLEDPFNQYIRAIFYFNNGKMCAFSDLRKFGYIKLLNQEDYLNLNKEFGPEPFEEGFNTEYLKEIFSQKKIPIKKVLMDQKLIAGIGNIYADEILWRSKIHPLTKANLLNDDEIASIFKNTRTVLSQAIKLGGTSVSDFRNTSGSKGRFEKALGVYKRDGRPCPNDGAIIKRIVVGGRGTHFCPLEQKEKK